MTPKQTGAYLRARFALDGVHTLDGVPVVPTGPAGLRPDAHAPAAIETWCTLAVGQALHDLGGAYALGSVPEGLGSALSVRYLRACLTHGRPPNVRSYWGVLWAMYDAGLVVAEGPPDTVRYLAVPGVAEGDIRGIPLEQAVAGPGTVWVPRAWFRDATDAELAAAGRTRADVEAHGAALEALARLNQHGTVRDVVAEVGEYAERNGLTGRASEMTAVWLAERGVTAERMTQIGRAALAALAEWLPEGTPEGVLSSPAHGWHLASAYRAGAPAGGPPEQKWTAAMTAFVLAGYLDRGDGLDGDETPPPGGPGSGGTGGTRDETGGSGSGGDGAPKDPKDPGDTKPPPGGTKPPPGGSGSGTGGSTNEASAQTGGKGLLVLVGLAAALLFGSQLITND